MRSESPILQICFPVYRIIHNVWGGTSLTDGADCSGFVQQIYKQYGYDLPRVAEDQSQCGTKIPVEDAQPGDLIFYAKGGHIYHVVMYAGDGKTIEASQHETWDY